MDRFHLTALAVCVGLLLGRQASVAGDGKDAGKKPADKVLKVGKDGIKIKGKLTGETKNVPYAIQMEEGKTYQIRLSSKDFDAYLYLKDDKGKMLDYDDDSGGGTNSLIEYRVLTSGVYVVIATSLGMGGTGEYEFTVTLKQ